MSNTINWVHRCIIVEDSKVQLARQLCAALAGSAGDGMFTTALSSDSSLPATHWISSGFISSEFVDALSNAEVLESTYQSTGLSTEFNIQKQDLVDLLDTSSITEEEPLAALDRLGLKLVNVE